MSLLSASSVSVSFGSDRRIVHALNSITVEFHPGSVTLLIGPSGSGKTTLLTVLGGLLKPTKGSIFAQDLELYKLSSAELAQFRLQRIGFVFQQGRLLRALSVLDNVMLPARLLGIPRAVAAASAAALLAELDISALTHEKPPSLSGGEAQRVALCRALINQPSILLADEPTAALDAVSGHRVANLLRESAKRRNTTVIIVTHDNRVSDIADRVVPMVDGTLRIEQGEAA